MREIRERERKQEIQRKRGREEESKKERKKEGDLEKERMPEVDLGRERMVCIGDRRRHKQNWFEKMKERESERLRSSRK